ncbi:MAG TPA: gamma carbonic anhydrase family protein [bacterium]|nr:gamma carbonic anhydrase family protein [bacterium]
MSAMRIEHLGKRPHVDESAWVAPNAVLSGPVQVGPHARVLYGAVLTAEGGAALTVGAECVIMEQAVLRAAGRFPLRLAERVLVGPHAYLAGCTVGARSFIATGAMIFNGAVLGEACTVALGGKVHVDTELAGGTRVPMGHIAFGRPGRIYPPGRAPSVHDELGRLDFMRYVFGVASAGRTRASVMDDVMRKYVRALGAHRADKILRGNR